MSQRRRVVRPPFFALPLRCASEPLSDRIETLFIYPVQSGPYCCAARSSPTVGGSASRRRDAPPGCGLTACRRLDPRVIDAAMQALRCAPCVRATGTTQRAAVAASSGSAAAELMPWSRRSLRVRNARLRCAGVLRGARRQRAAPCAHGRGRRLSGALTLFGPTPLVAMQWLLCRWRCGAARSLGDHITAAANPRLGEARPGACAAPASGIKVICPRGALTRPSAVPAGRQGGRARQAAAWPADAARRDQRAARHQLCRLLLGCHRRVARAVHARGPGATPCARTLSRTAHALALTRPTPAGQRPRHG